MFKFIRVALAILILNLAPNVWAQDAAILPPAKTTFFTNDGKPLTSGKVYFYVPNTSTLKTTWQDQNQNVANTNPVILDASGRATIFGDGSYRQVVRDRNNNLIWDSITASVGSGGGGSTTGDGDLVGTIKPWAGLIAPNQYLFAYGQEISRVTYPILFTAITTTTKVFCTNSSPILTGLADTTQIPVGAAVEVSCMASGTIVLSKTSSTITVNNNANLTTSTDAVILPWGGGNGSTTFNLPDFRGRILPGRNNMGGISSSVLTDTFYGTVPDALGAAGGVQSKTLITNNLPPYTPAGTIGITDPGHNHTQVGVNNMIGTSAGTGGSTGNNAPTSTSSTGITATFSGTAQGGTSVPFSLVQPSLTVNYIIKVIPDTAGTTNVGVTDIQGMTGSISCGTGLLCTGNIINVVLPTSGLTVGITPIISGTNYGVLYNNAGILGNTAAGTSGYSLIGNGASAPTFQGFTQTGTGASTRTWQNKNRDILNIADFGAVCNGSTDDTTAIQAAWNAAAAAGKDVNLSGVGIGVCKITTLTAPQPTNGETGNRAGLVGAGSGTVTLLSTVGVSDCAIIMAPNTYGTNSDLNVTFKGFSLTQITTPSVIGYGFCLTNVTQLQMYDVRITSFNRAIRAYDSLRLNFYNCSFIGNVIGVSGERISQTYPNAWTFISNTFAHNSQYALFMENAADLNIFGGDWENNGIGNASAATILMYGNPREGAKGLTLIGGYFSYNNGLADIVFDQLSQTYGGAHVIKGVEFDRTDGTVYVTNHIKLDNSGSGSTSVTIEGSGFSSYNSYTPNAGRPYISVVNSSSSNYVLESGGNYFQSATETPTSIWLKETSWVNFNSTLGCGSGTLTSASGVVRYKKLTNKTIAFNLVITVTTNGTCASYMTATFPVLSANNASYAGRDSQSGHSIGGSITAGTSLLAIVTYNSLYPAIDGSRLEISGVMESTP